MAIIDLDISELTTIYNNLKKIASEVDDKYQDVNKILNDLNMKVAARQDIDNDLTSIKNRLKKEKDYLSSCTTLMKSVIDSFKANDNISGHLPEYHFSLQSSSGSVAVAGAGAYPSGAMHATPDPAAQIEQIEKIRLHMNQEAINLLSGDGSGQETVDGFDYQEFLKQMGTGLK